MARTTNSSDKLELTWSNKDQRLLTHDDVTYEWVDPSDWRVSEVRLLDVVATHGTNHGDNLLIKGDALHGLEALTCIPEWAEHYVGKVKLCYIDPPFNTGQAFQQYDDNLEHSVWLTMLRDRLEQIHHLLADDGSVWVHLDDAESHRARCVLDEIFGAENFVASIVWQKRYSRENRVIIGSVHDSIHVYAKSVADWRKVRNLLPRREDKAYRNTDDDPRGPWRVIPLTVNGIHRNQLYEIIGPDGVVHRPPKGRSWSCVETTFQRYVAEGRVVFGRSGRGAPGLKAYLQDMPGLTPWSWWPHGEVGHTDEAKKEILSLFPDEEAFSTPKPERLLERIIHIGSDPGDIVLDCFAGSGTTAAVAHKMRRRWVTLELSGDTVDTYTRPRLLKVVAGDDHGGITEAVGWEGGGGFTEAVVAPTMFEQVAGTVLLSDWAVNGQLAEAVAAQLKFAREPEGPFIGRRGRTRLAVLDGMLTTGVAEHLVDRLDEGETLMAVALTLEDGVAEHLRELRPGSRACKVPRDLARSGKIAPRLVRLHGRDEGGADR